VAGSIATVALVALITKSVCALNGLVISSLIEQKPKNRLRRNGYLAI
jgi:hypothetical protein